MASTTSIAAALQHAAHSIPPAEARILLGHVLGQSAAWLIAHDDAPLDAVRSERFSSLVARRAEGEPVAYLTGLREFYGRLFRVTSAVLIPRPETELLVERALSAIQSLPAPRVLDLGTGSGALAVTLALEAPHAQVSALDQADAALQVTQDNAQHLGARLRLFRSDWFAALGDECFDVIVANPPYIAPHDAHLDQGDLRFEPRAALTDEVDGLSALRHIIATAPRHLRVGGRLCVEHGFDQAAAVAALFAESGFTALEQYADLAGIIRVSGGRCAVGLKPDLQNPNSRSSQHRFF